MEPATNQKNTPGRRRQNGPRNRNGPQKTYASENDVPSSRPVYHPASPSTPQKIAASGNACSSTTQKQRSNKGTNKNRNKKNSAPSPAHDSPAILANDPIFAGSTFHASPAASALPLPTFMRHMSSGDSPSIANAQANPAQEMSPPPTDSDDASATEDPVSRQHESPLEFFFRAARAEKANGRRASSANTATVPTAPFSPPDEPVQESSTLPKSAAHVHQHSARRPAYPQRSSSPGISATELDGSPGQPVGPAFSTPYQERIKAARSNQGSAQATPSANRGLDLNSSEALKRYLFTGQLDRASPQQQHSGQRQQPMEHSQYSPRPDTNLQAAMKQPSQPVEHSSNFPRGVFPATVLSGNAPQMSSSGSYGQAAPDADGRSEQILALEGNLRRMLKLDSVG